jgi:ABC-type branched-subunit amino acid transport system substrate-binding protein
MFSFRLSPTVRRFCAIAGLVASAALAGCQTAPEASKPVVPVAPATAPVATTAPTHPLTADDPSFTRLGNIPAGKTPVRVGLLLPFSNGSAQTRVLAASMMKAAQLALFDAGNPNIILISADEGSTPASAANGARSLLAQGAEVIVGPLFSASVNAVAPLARDRAVPVISFSTDKTVAGNGVYLLSFQPENEIHRIISYAAAQGHKNFAALVPASSYGQHITDAMKEQALAEGVQVVDVETLDPATEAASIKAIAASNADAVLIAAGGETLRTLAPSLVPDGLDTTKVKILGSGIWYDPANNAETALEGGIFAAPAPNAADAFNAKYRAAFGSSPPGLATLSYDAVALVALLSGGEPYHRFTPAALTDPNGFAGIDGIFRFNADGTSDRGLAILAVSPDGFRVVDPAPTTFEKPAVTPPPKTGS